MIKRYLKYGLFFSLFILIAGCKTTQEVNSSTLSVSKNWVGSWACAQMLVEPNNMPPPPGLAENTLRQIVKVSIGGAHIRFRFSNLFSDEATVLKKVSIADVLNAPEIDKNTQKELSFNGNQEITIEPGKEVFSDVLNFQLKPGQLLAITIYYGTASQKTTGHPGSRTTSYILQGDNVNNVSFEGAVKTDHWYSIMGLDVMASKKTAAIVCLGNSITDGRGSGTNRQNRWTDILAARLLADKNKENIGVLNLGIGGNCVVKGGLGPTALDRFDRDVLSQSGVKWLVILEGINDIGGIKRAEEVPQKTKEIIDAYKIMIDKAHAKGIKVYGCTILPFQKSFYDAPFKQEARDIVNAWIRNNDFDAVIDFDSEMASKTDLKTILPDMHDGDFLHPNELGYRRMGEVIDLNLFK
ncbi:SGNH/GDSL hydrolase family protein [Flavobacterium ustbae]|uniref:SGNH/GDSL hydrolase family protein n=1 Tax=Flavobacterium ustbae TaxID=2488790 RepID=UPI000F77A218|nr:SGNH/GDSL hydrolase family protein [Flavobacterium ustbae]